MKKYLFIIITLLFLSSCDFGGETVEKPEWNVNFQINSFENGYLYWQADNLPKDTVFFCDILKGETLDIPTNTTRDELGHVESIEAFTIREVTEPLFLYEYFNPLLLEDGIYILYLEMSSYSFEGNAHYCYAFEYSVPTSFPVRFIDKVTGDILKEMTMGVGELLTFDMYPSLPSSGVGYTVEWSSTEDIYIERDVTIYAVYKYDLYNINYINTCDDSVVAYKGYSNYAVNYENVYLDLLYSPTKRFLGWSYTSDGEPFKYLAFDKDNPQEYTLYAIWTDYTEEELEFYRQFNNTLNLEKYTLDIKDEKRFVSVDLTNEYLYIKSEKEDKNLSIELYYNGFYYDYDEEYYTEYEFEDIVSDIYVRFMDASFPRMNSVINIEKTSDGYEYDVANGTEIYHFVVTSNGKFFTSVKSEYNKSTIDVVLYDTVDKVTPPTDFNFQHMGKISIRDYDTNEIYFKEDFSFREYKDFLYYLGEIEYSLTFRNLLIDNLYFDKELTILFTEELFNQYKNDRITIYLKTIDKLKYLESIKVRVDKYVNYEDYNNHSQMCEYISSEYVDFLDFDYFKDLAYLKEWCKYGYINCDGNLNINDRLGYLFKDVELFDIEYILDNLDSIIKEEYIIEVYYDAIYYDTCHITLDGYGTFYHNRLFSPASLIIEKDGMIPDKFYYDKELTLEIQKGDNLGEVITIYASWIEGSIYNITFINVSNYEDSIHLEVRDNVYIYELASNIFNSVKPFYYDGGSTQFVHLNDKLEDGRIYYYDPHQELISFKLKYQDDKYLVYGYENSSLEFINKYVFNYESNFEEVDSSLDKLGVMPIYDDTLIKFNNVYELDVIPYAKYTIYLDGEIYKEGYINNRFKAIIEEERYIECTLVTYIKDEWIDTYLTLDLNTKIKYVYNELPKEDIILYIVGDYNIVTLQTLSGNLIKYRYQNGCSINHLKENNYTEFSEYERLGYDYYNLMVDGRIITDYEELLEEKTYVLVGETYQTTKLIMADNNSITVDIKPDSYYLKNGFSLMGPSGFNLKYELYLDADFTKKLTKEDLNGSELIVYRKAINAYNLILEYSGYIVDRQELVVSNTYNLYQIRNIVRNHELYDRYYIKEIKAYSDKELTNEIDLYSNDIPIDTYDVYYIDTVCYGKLSVYHKNSDDLYSYLYLMESDYKEESMRLYDVDNPLIMYDFTFDKGDFTEVELKKYNLYQFGRYWSRLYVDKECTIEFTYQDLMNGVDTVYITDYYVVTLKIKDYYTDEVRTLNIGVMNHQYGLTQSIAYVLYDVIGNSRFYVCDENFEIVADFYHNYYDEYEVVDGECFYFIGPIH